MKSSTRCNYKSVRSRLHHDCGAGLAEASISLFFFLVVVLGGIELAVAGYRLVAVNYVSSKVTRWATLGQQLPDPNGPGNLTRARSIELRATELGRVYGLRYNGDDFNAGPMPHVKICAATDPNYPNCAGDNPGDAGDLLQITLEDSVRIIFFNIPIEASSLGRLEPF